MFQNNCFALLVLRHSSHTTHMMAKSYYRNRVEVPVKDEKVMSGLNLLNF